MALTVRKYASERDMVAQYLFPKIKQAADTLGYGNILDLAVEKTTNGTPDLSVFRGGQALFLIEAKFKRKIGKKHVNIEPRDPLVIKQAVDYAVDGGFRYYATCNDNRLVLYKFVVGKKPHESEIASFEYEKVENWSEQCLKYVLELVKVKPKEVDDSLVDTLREAYEDLYPEFQISLKQKLTNTDFKERYNGWLASQGIRLDDSANSLIASQSTYLQINKLLFYQVVRQIYPSRLSKLVVRDDDDVNDVLCSCYEKVKSIDYDPVYQIEVISEIPFTARAKERFRTLLDTLNEFDFSTMKSDFLGRVYEKLIPPMERKKLGQFYTPRDVVDFITKLTVTNKDAVVLDPCCGSGTFLVGTYHKLRQDNKIPRTIEGGIGEIFHKQLLEKIYGVDINQFPSHLSVINLTIQNPKAKIDKIGVIVKDFFDIQAGQTTLSGFQSMDTNGKQKVVEIPQTFDAVVANPPYIRQELLGEAEKRKIKHLIETEYKGKVFIGKPSKLPKGKAVILDKQSDIYIYFYIHGLKLLKENGKLGFISSNKWLEVGYGEPFQEFLLEHCKILYVVEFDRAIFPDADVNTTVVILEKEPNSEKRRTNKVKFIRFKQKLPLDVMSRMIKETDESIDRKDLCINVIEQDKLQTGKWNQYLRAPPVFQKIVTNPMVKPLEEVCNLMRAPTTGHNDYFILSKDRMKEWSIERRYLKPCLLSPKNAKGLVVRDTEHYMLFVPQSKEELKSTKVLQYIKHGEELEVEVTRGSETGKRKLPKVETVVNRKPFWYSLPELEVPIILFPRLTDVKPIFLRNDGQAHTPHVFYYIYPKDTSMTDAILAYLNSSVCALLVELNGRSYGGGVLELLVYEAKQIPVLDFSRLSKADITKLANRFNALAKSVDNKIEAQKEFDRFKSKSDKDKGLFEGDVASTLDEAMSNEKQAQRRLDEVIYDILGLSKNERQQVEQGLWQLQELRKLRRET